MKKITALTLAAALACTAAPVLAQSQGDWTVGLGFAGVFPKDNNGVLAGPTPIDVDEGYSLTITAEYFIAENLGVELLAAWPFEHDINTNGTKIGQVKHLPPTLSLQYHFANSSAVTPFVGAGINYTTFVEDKAVGPLAGNSLSVDDSWGLALHAGLDYEISPSGSLRADVRWIDIESDVKLNGVNIGKAKIDPWIFGLAYVHKF
ncbi:Outer membrane protein W precursor [Roseovarius litorisediminis]|uniref:Outer membrane protein W n=1 Tax=Roseovarius litorisediminis TaxID=1312363 RepID=A0A1Y5S6K8_9RHOB|nr:OmpW family outer membrane protein [Roseovarius litorisediminis]SLN33695.1 Outer membrane protein W precursor [Roseovarius litorisediminis]